MSAKNLIIARKEIFENHPNLKEIHFKTKLIIKFYLKVNTISQIYNSTHAAQLS